MPHPRGAIDAFLDRSVCRYDARVRIRVCDLVRLARATHKSSSPISRGTIISALARRRLRLEKNQIVGLFCVLRLGAVPSELLPPEFIRSMNLLYLASRTRPESVVWGVPREVLMLIGAHIPFRVSV